MDFKLPSYIPEIWQSILVYVIGIVFTGFFIRSLLRPLASAFVKGKGSSNGKIIDLMNSRLKFFRAILDIIAWSISAIIISEIFNVFYFKNLMLFLSFIGKYLLFILIGLIIFTIIYYKTEFGSTTVLSIYGKYYLGNKLDMVTEFINKDRGGKLSFKEIDIHNCIFIDEKGHAIVMENHEIMRKYFYFHKTKTKEKVINSTIGDVQSES